MSPEEYQRHDMLGLAALIARREVTAAEVLEAALARMAVANPKVNAVILDLSEAARRVASGTPAGPLAGVPYLMKDHGAAMAGVPTMMSCEVFRDLVPPRDSAMVAALRAAGLVIFGKTNTPEVSNDATTESRMHGPARNPWSLAHSPGGSSGGSAAAVAAGIVPAAHGSDGGGSIRIPASSTGLFGLKPTRGRVSVAPGNEGPGGFVVGHALTRSVRDSAVLLDIVSIPQPGDRHRPPMPERPFLEEVGRPPGLLRIGVNVAAFDGGRIAPECAEVVRGAASLCEALGHHVEEVELPVEAYLAAAAGGVANAASIASMLDAAAARRGRPISEDELEPITYMTYLRGKGVTAVDYLRAQDACHVFCRAVETFFLDYDVLLNSTAGSPPIRIGELHGKPLDTVGYGKRLGDYIVNTRPANYAGQPAMSVPLAWTPGGLPIGIQFTARMGGEALLLRLAGQLEQARPWAARRPTAID
jgi:amidase